MKVLKNGHFWAGIAVGVVLLSFFPQLNPRTVLARPKAA
jgi:hypothetical protein